MHRKPLFDPGSGLGRLPCSCSRSARCLLYCGSAAKLWFLARDGL